MQVLGDLHSKTASITNTLLVNPTKSGSSGYLDITTGDSTVDLGPNLRVSGAAITATAATAVNLGTSVADTTLSVGNARAVIGAGTGGTGILTLGNTVGNLNIGTGGAGTIKLGAGAAGKANINGQLGWGNNAGSGLLSSDGNGAIELGPTSGGGSPTPFIDFHNNGSAGDCTARIINIAAGLQLNSGNVSYLTLSDAAGIDSTISGNQLVIPTADYSYGTNMGRAVNKDWVYNVLTTAAADSFFSVSAKDAIIDQILNNATGQTNYNILRNNILDYLPTRSQMGIAGALKADLGTNKQYWGTHCPGGYQIRATAYDSTSKQYFVECSPDCQNSGAPCPTVYVSNTLSVTGQICLNGICKTSWGGVECGIGRFMYGLSAKGYPMCRNIGFAP